MNPVSQIFCWRLESKARCIDPGCRNRKREVRRVLRASTVIPKTIIIIDFAAPCRNWALRSVTFGIVLSRPQSDPRPPQSNEFLIESRQNGFDAREFTEIYEGWKNVAAVS